MTPARADALPLKVLMRWVAFGVLIGAALLNWPMSAAEMPADGSTPLVQIYTTKSCGYCKLLRRYLNARGIAYAEHDINATPDTRRAFYASGAQGVPLVVIGEQRIQGFNPLAIEKALAGADAPDAPYAQSRPG